MPPKSGKKGKGGPQNASGTKVKATKAVPMDASDSEDDSSDLGSSEEDEAPPVGKAIAVVKKTPAPAKKQEPSDDDSDDDSEESDEDKPPVNAVKQAKKNVAESDEEDSESEEEEEEKPMVGQKRKLPQLNVQPPKKATKGNKNQKPENDSEDEEDSDDEEDSEESEASEDEPVVDLKKQKQFQQKNKANVNGKLAQKAAAAEESSEDEEDSVEESEEEESEEDDEEEEVKVKEKTKGKEGKKKNKESVKATDAVPDGDIVTIFCGNLKDDCGPKELRKFFKKNGLEITDARKQVGKRFGYVDLVNASDLKAALALDQSSFQDQEIKVEQAKRRPDMTGTPKTPTAAKDVSQKDDKDCTLFVKNLADSVTEKILREFFSDAVELRLPKSPNGSHKGFAYIEFKDAGIVEKMINKYQGAELEGQALYLDYVGQKSSFKSPQANKSSGEAGKSKVLFVKNLSYSVTDDKLLDTFEGAVSVRIPTFPDTGKPKGFAFIDFESSEAAQEAYDKCQGQELEGREMKVDFALDRGDRGGRSPGGNFGGRGRGGGGGRGNFRGGRGGRGGNWDRGGRGGRGGGRGGGDRGFGDKRKSFDSSGSAKNKKVKLDSDSD